jgi:branched-chain amino acid transport system substrate-binding protein
LVLAKVQGKLNFKRLAILYDQTQDAQAGDAEVCRTMKAKLGYDIVADEAFSSGSQDFSAQITKIKAANPDAMFVASTTGDGVKVVPQIRTAGIDVPLMTGYGAFQDPLYWNGTNGAIKGCFTWLAQDLAGATGTLRKWVDDYNAKYELKATSFSTYGYDAIMCAVECAKRAASTDREKIQEQMAELDYQSPIGTHITFKNPPSGENITPTVTVIEVTGPGTYVAVT